MRLRRPRYDVPESVVRQLRRRRWTRRGVFVALFLVAISSVVGRLTFRGDDWNAFDRKMVTVIHVHDGDTLRIRRSPEAAEESVRLLGIDAPEIGEPGGYWGGEATARLKNLAASGAEVTVRLDGTQSRDKYRRLLAYVYAGGGAESVNLSLVREGHAYAHRRFEHSMSRQFEQAEDEARGKGRGLWADVSESQMPDWRRQWLAERRANRAAGR